MIGAFANGLRQAIRDQDLTPLTVANLADLPEQTVIAILQGDHDPCARLQQQLAAAIGHTPTDLHALADWTLA